jgi:4-hydroxybenzoate polyprenyltransferase
MSPTSANPAAGKHRSRTRAYLLLARVSNLPTVWTNVIAGAALAGVAMHTPLVTGVALAVSCWYAAGMWMNDACDASIDAVQRSDRPIPNGDVTRREVWIGTVLLTLAGVVILFAAHADRAAWPWVALLAAAISYYDVRHKGDPFGPAAMGLCRGLIYVISASALGQSRALPVWIGALVLIIYVLSLTWVGKTLGPRAGSVMPWLIAGISLVDAVLILTMAPMPAVWWALAAIAGFFVTLAGQRVVPGT